MEYKTRDDGTLEITKLYTDELETYIKENGFDNHVAEEVRKVYVKIAALSSIYGTAVWVTSQKNKDTPTS